MIVTGRLEQRSWETAEGDKRSKIEVVADELGPSLRWATAQVVKNERRGPSEGGGPGGGSARGASPRPNLSTHCPSCGRGIRGLRRGAFLDGAEQ